jgi:phenylacetate-CoA ligase
MFKLFDLTLKLNGFPMKKAKAELQNILAIPEKNFSRFVEQKKAEIVHFHLNNNPFYRELVGTDTFANWSDLPILNKKNVQKPLKERLSFGHPEKSVYLNKTSGSSGHPFVFAKDKYCHALTWASNIYRFGWYGIDFNTSYQARFYGIPMDFIGNKKDR